MGQCFLYGNGGKDRLVLRVFGQTSAPADPRNNDIWVNTSIPIGGWEFSEVSNPTWSTSVSGFVYFTSTYSGANDASTSTGLNFLKEWTHSIYTKLLQCRQYDGSSWVRKNAYIYHDGWHQFSAEWDGTLFYNGEQYEAVTGGWASTKGFTSVSPNLVTGASVLYSKSAVDLTDWSSLHIYGELYSTVTGNWADAVIAVRSGGASGTVVASTRLHNYSNPGEITLDVSALTGGYTITVEATTNGGIGGKIDISKIWLT